MLQDARRGGAGDGAPIPRHRIGKHEIIVGDCVKAMADMRASSVDVVVTSPPYNIGVKYNSYDDNGDRQQYLTWLRKVALSIDRVLKPGGSFFLNVCGTASDPWVAFDVAAAMRDVFVLQNNIMWIKSVSINDETMGHYKPINSKRYLNRAHEHIFHFTKNGNIALDRLAIGVPFKDKSNIARWGHAEDRHCAGDTWFIPYRTIKSRSQKFHHPSPFPTELPERCIRLHGKPKATVLDPFLGIGSTLIAAEELGCKGVGIESDIVYAESAIKRLQEALR